MTPGDVAAQVELWIKATYPTGISWLVHEDGTVTVEWVDDSSTEITVTVRDTPPHRAAP